MVKTPEQASHLEGGEKTLQSPSPKFNISFTTDVLSCFQFKRFLVRVCVFVFLHTCTFKSYKGIGLDGHDPSWKAGPPGALCAKTIALF